MMPKISVIIPVYKAEQTLRRCLDSILAQTNKDYEVLLVDDGSPDSSGLICDEYAAKDSRFVVIHQKNAGVASARNAALDLAQGEMCTFIDADDYVSSNFLEAVNVSNSDVIVLETKKVDISGNISPYCTLEETCSSDLQSYRSILGGILHEEVVRGAGGKIFRRTKVEDLRFNPGQKIGEDTLFMMGVYNRSNSIQVLNGYYYYVQLGPVHIRKKYELRAPIAINNASLIFSEYLSSGIDSPFFERLIYGFFFYLINKDLDYPHLGDWFEDKNLSIIADRLQKNSLYSWKFALWRKSPSFMHWFEPRYDSAYNKLKRIVKTIIGKK